MEEFMKRVITFAACLLLVAVVTCGHKNKRPSWVARYNGQGNGWDEANSIAVDNSGNVYVTGESRGGINFDYATVKYDSLVSYLKKIDYATVKYDSLGNELWVARYDGPVNEEDRAYSLALDNSGNVYVTGCSKGSALLGTDFDYATVKYDSLGNQLWVARYDGPGNEKDRAYSLVLDNSGNVYVTGCSKGSGTNMDYATIKYDSRGNELWVVRYNGPGNGTDRAYSLVLDNSGNVYVAGASQGLDSTSDYATIKYNSLGKQLWVVRYNGPGNGTDRANSIAVDNSSNVYVTGCSKGSGTNMDYATIKYDSRGNELWVARYDGPGNGTDRANSIAVDNSSNVYVTGESVGSGINSDYATVKYDSLGNELWVTRYDGPGIISLDRAYSLALDNSGNVYVTGYNQRFLSKNSDYATVKYDSLGNELWVARYDAPGNGWDRPNSIAVDNSGNVYVTGFSKGSGTNMDYATIKYGPDGQ
ncbi:SBBP repeat-containing protein [candidate division WOR-3 bacterium]|nr:SBBP repeat-containing protein [candidate division WOR-3 bacterium]